MLQALHHAMMMPKPGFLQHFLPFKKGLPLSASSLIGGGGHPPFSTTSQTFTECSLDAVFCSLVSDYFDPSQPRYLRLQVRQRCGDDKSIADAHWNIGDRHSVEGSLEMPTDASLLHV